MSVTKPDLHSGRLLALAAVFVAFAVVAALRLGQYQIRDHDYYLHRAIDMQSDVTVIEARRGAIRDRNGRVLAISLHNDDVVGDPLYFQGLAKAVQNDIVAAAAPILNIPAEQIRAQLLAGATHYSPLKSGVPLTVSQELVEAGVTLGIYVDPKVKRNYPSGALLSQTLGFLNGDGQGIGIEGSYNQDLKGVPGQRIVGGETYGQGLSQVPTITQPQNGADITLTVDLNIQYKVERELEDALRAEKTMTGTIVVMNPKTGEILALAGRPTFDPNNYQSVPSSAWNNPIVTDAWEPGSIFKIITMAAALDANKVDPKSTFVDRGTMKYHGVSITNMDNKANGTITPAQILQYSSNVGTVQVADVLSTTAFYTYAHGAFGVGVKTGIDLPGEVEGNIRLPGDPQWNQIDLATHSFGQGLSVTPIQMVTMVSAVANKGLMMRPFIVSRVAGPTDTAEGPGPLRKVIKSETAATLTDMLVSVVETTVKQARVPGYHLAGKTGTALIPPPSGTYDPNETIASFIGYGPAEDPQFVILVRIDRPQVHQTGTDVAAPVFQHIASWMLSYLKIPPSDVKAQR